MIDYQVSIQTSAAVEKNGMASYFYDRMFY